MFVDFTMFLARLDLSTYCTIIVTVTHQQINTRYSSKPKITCVDITVGKKPK